MAYSTMKEKELVNIDYFIECQHFSYSQLWKEVFIIQTIEILCSFYTFIVHQGKTEGFLNIWSSEGWEKSYGSDLLTKM